MSTELTATGIEKGGRELSDLLPCPFCGCDVELTSSKTLGDRLFWIKCPDDSPCSGSGLGMYVVAGQVEAATAVWNRRATPNQTGEVDRT